MVTKKKVTEEVLEIPSEIEKQLLSIDMLPVDELFIDRAYQRDLDSSRTINMANNWNWLACGSLVVSLRNGEDGKNRYAVIDGQQRLHAIKHLKFNEAPCRIYLDLTQIQEAELYELLNKNKKPTYNDLFKSRLLRGEQMAKSINMAAEQVNYHLDFERRHHSEHSKDAHFYIQTMAELERIYKIGGVTLIMDTLRMYRDLWAPDYVNNQQMVLAGIATFLKDYPSVKKIELVQKIRREGQMKMLQKALQYQAVHGKQGGSNTRGRAYAEAMLIVYNTNRQESNRVRSKA